MKLVAFASLFVIAALSFALAGMPATTEADSHTSTCQTCGKSPKPECPHCAAGEACPHCNKGRHGSWAGHAWEYKCVRPSKKVETMTEQFNALGAEGWKLKQADNGFWCFAKMKSN